MAVVVLPLLLLKLKLKLLLLLSLKLAAELLMSDDYVASNSVIRHPHPPPLQQPPTMRCGNDGASPISRDPRVGRVAVI